MTIKDPARQLRSLRSCHTPAEERPIRKVRDSRAYVPELSERLERDTNLCDGARRCARILAAYSYRRDRETRASDITVTYLSRALGRCRRTVQRYLRQLERAGYIQSDVIASSKSRLCIGLAVTLLRPLFPQHHAHKWPVAAMNSGATRLSQKHSSRYKTTTVSREHWALRCMDGVFRSLMRTIPPMSALL
jgi:Helix-turn-helix domain